MLGDALRSLLLGRSLEEWNVVLPQIMHVYHSTPHSSMQETPKLSDARPRARVLDHLTYHVPTLKSPVHKYVGKLVEIMEQTHDALWEKQWWVRMEEFIKPPYTR